MPGHLPGVRWLFPTATARLLPSYGHAPHRAWFRPNSTRTAAAGGWGRRGGGDDDSADFRRSVSAVLALVHHEVEVMGLDPVGPCTPLPTPLRVRGEIMGLVTMRAD
jgi:hypothetical protein